MTCAPYSIFKSNYYGRTILRKKLLTFFKACSLISYFQPLFHIILTSLLLTIVSKIKGSNWIHNWEKVFMLFKPIIYIRSRENLHLFAFFIQLGVHQLFHLWLWRFSLVHQTCSHHKKSEKRESHPLETLKPWVLQTHPPTLTVYSPKVSGFYTVKPQPL